MANGSRPRPVMVITMTNAGLAALLGFAGVADLVPKTVLGWLALGYAVWTAVTGAYLQGQVTPISNPMDNQGNKLVPINTTPGKTLR
jgi:hypothetical protein